MTFQEEQHFRYSRLLVPLLCIYYCHRRREKITFILTLARMGPVKYPNAGHRHCEANREFLQTINHYPYH